MDWGSLLACDLRSMRFADPGFGIKVYGFLSEHFPYLEVYCRDTLIIIYNCTQGLFGSYNLVFFYLHIGQVIVYSKVVGMFDHHRLIVAGKNKNAGYNTIEYRPGCCALRCLYIYTSIIYHHLMLNRVWMFAKMVRDIAFFNGPI